MPICDDPAAAEMRPRCRSAFAILHSFAMFADDDSGAALTRNAMVERDWTGSDLRESSSTGSRSNLRGHLFQADKARERAHFALLVFAQLKQ